MQEGSHGFFGQLLCQVWSVVARLPDFPRGLVQMTFKPVVWCVLVLTLGGCGTVKTVFNSDAQVSAALKKESTYCDSVPRVYSGAAFDLCVLHAPANTTGKGGGLIPLLFVDVVASALADTLALPYTIYRQSRDGSILLH